MLEYISFRGDRLTIVWRGEEAYVAAKPICERLGLDWKAQYDKLVAPENGSVVVFIPTTGADGKTYSMLCLHIADVPIWLLGIQPSRVKPELRGALLAYRNECRLVLHNYFRTRLLGERDGALASCVALRAQALAANRLWTKLHVMAEQGWGFEQIWRGCNRPRLRVSEALHQAVQCGLLVTLPQGTPGQMFTAQPDLFAEI